MIDDTEKASLLDPEAMVSPPSPGEPPTRARRTSTKLTTARAARKAKSGAATLTSGQARASRRARTARAFPASTFEDARALAEAIWEHADGERVRRLTLFDAIGKSPESGPSRQLITNSGKYGLTSGSYAAEYMELTPKGRLGTNPDGSARDRAKASFELAIDDIPVFRALYENYVGKKLPSQAVIRDFLREQGIPDDQIQEAIDTFTLNAKALGLLRVMAGAERLISIEQLLEETTGTSPALRPGVASTEPAEESTPEPARGTSTQGRGSSRSAVEWSRTCFYVTPIGSPGTEPRQHSDLFLGSLVEPAVTQFELVVVRADQIGKAGLITAQVIDHIVNARLVIADLSFHNPNVFYELALRHAKRLPVVQLIRQSDPIPFDLEQFRTIQIDTSSIYALVPQLETYRAEIANHIRRALGDGSDVENPLTAFYPMFWD